MNMVKNIVRIVRFVLCVTFCFFSLIHGMERSKQAIGTFAQYCSKVHQKEFNQAVDRCISAMALTSDGKKMFLGPQASDRGLLRLVTENKAIESAVISYIGNQWVDYPETVSAMFSPDDNYLLVSAKGNYPLLYNMQTQATIFLGTSDFPTTRNDIFRVMIGTFSPDKKYIAVIDSTNNFNIVLYETRTGILVGSVKLAQSNEVENKQIIWLSENALCLGTNKGIFHITFGKKGAVISSRLAYPESVNFFVSSADKKVLIAGKERKIIAMSFEDNELKFLPELDLSEIFAGNILCVASSYKGDFFVVGTDKGEICVLKQVGTDQKKTIEIIEYIKGGESKSRMPHQKTPSIPSAAFIGKKNEFLVTNCDHVEYKPEINLKRFVVPSYTQKEIEEMLDESGFLSLNKNLKSFLNGLPGQKRVNGLLVLSTEDQKKYELLFDELMNPIIQKLIKKYFPIQGVSVEFKKRRVLGEQPEILAKIARQKFLETEERKRELELHENWKKTRWQQQQPQQAVPIQQQTETLQTKQEELKQEQSESSGAWSRLQTWFSNTWLGKWWYGK